MSRHTKISTLKAAFLSGARLSPNDALRLRMQANTFHRTIHELRHRHGMMIVSAPMVSSDGTEYNVYWCEGVES